MSAIFSGEIPPLHRYRLDRDLGLLGKGWTVGFMLHNSSKAGVDLNDPTSRRAIGFATSWHASRLIMANPWAGIATKPADLWKMADPVGLMNDFHIGQIAIEIRDSGGFMLVGWGSISPPARLFKTARQRLKAVETILRDHGCPICALGVNKDGSPKHPLYVRADAEPLAWPDSWGTQSEHGLGAVQLGVGGRG